MGHVHASGAAGISRGTGHGAAMVSLAGADHRIPGAESALGEEGLDGKPGAEKLERIEPEPVRLVLEAHGADT